MKNEWRLMTSMARPILKPTLAVINGLLYAFGDFSMECYDPKTDRWTSKTPPSISNGIRFALNGQLYVLNASVSDDFLGCYDPENNTWTKVSGLLSSAIFVCNTQSTIQLHRF